MERWSLRTRRPANICNAAGTLPPSRPKRCSPNQLGKPRMAMACRRSTIASRSPSTCRSISLKRLPASDALGQVHAEALRGHRMPVLLPGIADAHFRHASPLRQLFGHGHGVGTALANVQQQVLAFTARLEGGQFINLEILRRAAHQRA
jgi:hypothetical protein